MEKPSRLKEADWTGRRREEEIGIKDFGGNETYPRTNRHNDHKIFAVEVSMHVWSENWIEWILITGRVVCGTARLIHVLGRGTI